MRLHAASQTCAATLATVLASNKTHFGRSRGNPCHVLFTKVIVTAFTFIVIYLLDDNNQLDPSISAEEQASR